MSYLRNLVESDGTKIFITELSSPVELFPDYDLVVNCSGVWARSLVNDNSVFPIRGQVVRIAPPPDMHGSIRIYQRQGPFTLILPRSNECILGGTAQENDWSLTVRERETLEILERCSKIVPAVAECKVLSEAVGLRPGRKEVRLELEMAGPNRPIVHNYGHGGGGFTVAWGCANEVARIVQDCLS
jgi:D-amino-acid oxidase